MTTQFPNCQMPTLLPQCLPPTSPIACHILTQPQQCIPQTSPAICHVTQPPQCFPQTSPAICHFTQPQQCFPQTLAGPICNNVTSPVMCRITRNHPLCDIQQCQANTRIFPTKPFDPTIVQNQTPVFNGGVAAGGGLAAPAQAQNFAGAAAPEQQFAAQANFGPTGIQHCTVGPQFCGNTAWQPCPPIGQTGVQYCTAAPQFCGNTAWQPCQPIGQTGVQNCTAAPQFCGNTAWQPCPPQQTQMAIHPTTNPTANTHCFICPPLTVDALQAAPQQAQAMNPTASTHCFVCPPPTLEAQQQVGPTGVHFCTAAPQLCGHTAWPNCQPLLSAPPHCPTVSPVCQPQAVAPTHLLGCTCLPMTVGPVIPTNNMPICGNTCLPMTVGPVIPTQNMPICGNTCLPMTIGPVIPTNNMPICGNTCLPMTVGPVMTVAAC